jgi:hypothetical protein
MLDGDGQHNPDEIPAIVAPILEKEIDLVIGSRFLRGNNKIPAHRQIGQKILDLVTNLSYGGVSNEYSEMKGRSVNDKVAMRSGGNEGVITNGVIQNRESFKTTDSQSGYRALSLKALNNMDFYSEGYNIESDMFAHFLDRGLKIDEVPITVKYDIANSHKKNTISHGLDVLGHIVGLIGYKRPLLSFGIPGVIIILMGLITASAAFASYYETAKFSYLLTMVSGLCLVLGMLFISIALTLNSLVQIVKMERARA